MTVRVRAFLYGGLLSLLPVGLLVAAPATGRNEKTPSPPADSPAEPRAGSTDASVHHESEADSAESDIPTIDVLEGIRSRKLAVKAEGTGDGKMTLSLTNKTSGKLRVVLPPGLIAAGASGQFGGMGGMMGGGMGGGMMGGGMGGMGGMRGGMGGGMGMMGGGMRGGMMGGRGMGGGTMPASMGMMMLGRLIMTLVGERDSWNMMSLMAGMMGGRGMMGGMGMMGGGMGMMGGGMGMMGGMGGGFRSVPPTSLPQTTLKPKQTKSLPTVAVSLDGPGGAAGVKYPAQGEPLRVGAIGQLNRDPKTTKALERLAADKAPQTVAQLALWNVAGGVDWPTIERLSQPWANAHERTLARQFVKQLSESKSDDKAKAPGTAETGTLYWELKVASTENESLGADIRKLLEKSSILGLKTQAGVPAAPEGPALALRATLRNGRLDIEAAASSGDASRWLSLGSDSVKLKAPEAGAKPLVRAAAVLDEAAAGLVGRLVRATLSRGPAKAGKLTYRVRIDNASPLILNGLALAGAELAPGSPVTALSGLSLPPRRSLTVGVSSELVDRLKLKEKVNVVAADLSGL